MLLASLLPPVAGGLGCGGKGAVVDANGHDAGIDVDTVDSDTSGDVVRIDSTPGSDAASSPTGCSPFPAPSGATVSVTAGMNLVSVVAAAPAGATILLADGTYALGGAIVQIRSAGITLRSASGDATKVIIDGAYTSPEVIAISASDVTLAELTITHAVDHPVHVYPNDAGPNVTGTLLYAVRLIDNGEQFLKVNPNSGRSFYVDTGRVECSLFQMTAAGRSHIETLNGTSCYTGGIDVHGGRGWIVRQNRFEGIYCTDGKLAEHAIHFWNGARDTLVENNIIVNCARGIGYGLIESGEMRVYADNPYPGVGYIGHFDGIVRNNFIFADVPAFDTGVELAQAQGTKVFHNTIYAGPQATGFYSSIDTRFTHSMVDLRNNLVQRITMRDGAIVTSSNNKDSVPATYFRDPAGGDLHLLPTATDAIDKGIGLPEAGLDIDGEPHTSGAAPDVGADELR
jgi:hypothetical protein